MITDDEIRVMALEAVPPSGTLDVVARVEHTHGGKIAGTDLWSGIGGETRYGAAWFDGLKATPFGPDFENQRDAFKLINALAGEGSELWSRKEARRARIAEREAAAAAEEAEEMTLLKEAARAAKKSIHSLSVTERKRILGAGSSRPSRSSEKPSDSTRMRLRVEEQAQ